MSERQLRATGRNTDMVASFLLKTYEILEHPDNKKMISWDKDGIGFVVSDVIAFTREILPRYFRHSNFSSFVRQLNMYDFHKVKQYNDSLVFKNPQFCRDEKQKLRFIKRKATKKMSGHRRFYHEKHHSHNEKYAASLKWLKKSLETYVSQSCTFFYKSLDLLKENNDSNKIKIVQLANIKESYPADCLGILFALKEECDQQLARTEKWLDEHNEVIRRKIKTITNFSLQLQQSQKEFVPSSGDDAKPQNYNCSLEDI